MRALCYVHTDSHSSFNVCSVLVSHMAPVLSDRPKHSCKNYPLCQESQKKLTSSCGSRERLSHCASCLERARCAFPNCQDHIPPSSGRYRTDLCAFHYRDPCNSDHRTWKLCSHSRVGCSHLAMTPRSGKCFSCAEGGLPCAHSMLGCSKHVRNPPKTCVSSRASCSGHASSRCPFDPSNGKSCSSLAVHVYRTRKQVLISAVALFAPVLFWRSRAGI